MECNVGNDRERLAQHCRQKLQRWSSEATIGRPVIENSRVALLRRAARDYSAANRGERVMWSIGISAVVVTATVISSASAGLAAEHQRARHAGHHTGFASLDYGRTGRTMFDGTWSLSANTTAGSCGSSGLRVTVVNGRVVSPGVSGVSGRVRPGGNVSVTVRQSSGVVIGAGRLSTRSGTGRWTAHSSSGRCVGYWQAQRSF